MEAISGPDLSELDKEGNIPLHTQEQLVSTLVPSNRTVMDTYTRFV